MYQFTKMNHNGIIAWDKKLRLKCKKKNMFKYDNSVLGKEDLENKPLQTQGEHGNCTTKGLDSGIQPKILLWGDSW